MKQVSSTDMWPPPDWEEVVVPWSWIMESHRRDISIICEWVDRAPGGRYHLHGKGKKYDFAFRFENPADATYFRLNLPR